jgi:HK97 family phage major capsid protein
VGREIGLLAEDGHVGVSIDYEVLEVRAASDEEGPYRDVTRWRLLALSFVSLPADAAVGVGRSLILTQGSQMSTTTPAAPAAPSPAPETRSADLPRQHETVTGERALQLAAQFGLDPNEVLPFVHERRSMDALAEFISAKRRVENRLSNPGRELRPPDVGPIDHPFARAVFGQVPGSRIELGPLGEAQRDLTKRYGAPRGVAVPITIPPARQTRGAGKTTGVGWAKELVPTSQGEFIDLIRDRLVALQLGAQILPLEGGKAAEPRLDGDATAFWVAEDPVADVTDSELTIGQVLYDGKMLSARVPFTQKLLRQSTPMVDGVIQAALAALFAQGLEKGVLGGGGANQPVGITANADVPSVSVAGNITAAKVLEMEAALDALAAIVAGSAWVTTPANRAKMRAISRDTGSGVFLWGDDGRVLGYPGFSTNNMPVSAGNHSMIFGNFSDVAIATWGAIDFIVDPYTAAAKQLVWVTANWLVDVGIRRPKSFVKATNITVV